MTYQLLTPLKVKTPEGIRELQAGELIALPEDMALRLIEKGKVKPLEDPSSDALRELQTPRLPRPFLDLDGSLVIPFGSDSRYRWWKGGQSISETEEELKAWLH